MSEDLSDQVPGIVVSPMGGTVFGTFADAQAEMTAPGSPPVAAFYGQQPSDLPHTSGEEIPVSNAGTSKPQRDAEPVVAAWQAATPRYYGAWKSAAAMGHSGRRS